ncbi:MAG: transposase [Deltaproteobacteria bacterium]|nr:transposase [Deltaproteobacteria bacterium]
MNFSTQQPTYYCGIDLQAKVMYVCILDQSGTKLVHKNRPTTPEAFLRVIAPYRDDVVVGVECIFTWYWLADLCSQEGIAFVLGHALYMKASHGGKAKNDKIDAHKIAVLLRGGMLPQAYVYPVEMRPPAISCAAAVTWYRNEQNSWPTSRIPIVNTISRRSERSWPTKRIEKESKTTSPIPACARPLKWISPSSITMTNSWGK